MLNCSCADWEGDAWCYIPPYDFTNLNTSKRKRCCSCKKMVDKNATCLKFERFRPATSDIEERIHGGDVDLAPWYMCEWCGEMYLNLDALGYCHMLGDSMVETMHEYWKMTGFYK